jgi:hypothetical protein
MTLMITQSSFVLWGLHFLVCQDNDKEFVIYSAGPARINSFVSEFSNLSERGMKARGRKIKFYKVANAWLRR